VFADSIDNKKLTVISIKAKGDQCPNPGSNIQSMSEASLSAVGIESQPNGI
jgi:hypothetical protein